MMVSPVAFRAKARLYVPPLVRLYVAPPPGLARVMPTPLVTSAVAVLRCSLMVFVSTTMTRKLLPRRLDQAGDVRPAAVVVGHLVIRVQTVVGDRQRPGRGALVDDLFALGESMWFGEDDVAWRQGCRSGCRSRRS